MSYRDGFIVPLPLEAMNTPKSKDNAQLLAKLDLAHRPRPCRTLRRGLDPVGSDIFCIFRTGMTNCCGPGGDLGEDEETVGS